MIDLQDYSLATIFCVGLAAMIVATELGLWLGGFDLRRGKESAGSTLESAMLGLLALMIGFTFAIALSRFDARRDAILTEANTIGTAALRARLLPAPRDAQALALLNDYARIRIELTQHMPDTAALTTAIGRSNDIQESLWRMALEGAKADTGAVPVALGMVPTALFIQSLNEMIDAQGKRLAATRNRVPNSVILGLYLIAFVAIVFSGYSMGIQSAHSRPRIYVMATLLSGVILLLLDLDRPSVGFIAVSQQPLVDTATVIGGYLK